MLVTSGFSSNSFWTKGIMSFFQWDPSFFIVSFVSKKLDLNHDRRNRDPSRVFTNRNRGTDDRIGGGIDHENHVVDNICGIDSGTIGCNSNAKRTVSCGSKRNGG